MINEAPVSDIFFNPNNINQTSSFSSIDKKAINSPKALEKIKKILSKSPFDIEIHFIGHDEYDGDDEGTNEHDLDDFANKKAGIYKNYMGVRGESGKIKVILLSNLSPLDNKIPLTGWIIGHKIGHAIQDNFMRPKGSHKQLNNSLKKFLDMIDKAGNGLASIKTTGDPGTLPHELTNHMTNKSAATLENPFEIFPELIAQYIVSGKITFSKHYNDDRYVRYQDQINKLAGMFLNKLNGKVIVEV